MSHIYKTGNTGITVGGDGYEITAIGENHMLVKIYWKNKNNPTEFKYFKSGQPDTFGLSREYDLIRPKQ